jgi:hypothetical protein
LCGGGRDVGEMSLLRGGEDGGVRGVVGKTRASD